MTDKTRLQFDASDELVRTLDEVAERIGASSRAEVFRRAVRLLSVVSEQGVVVTIHHGDNKPVMLVVL